MKELATIGIAKTDDEIENRGSRLHLLRGIESLQGTGASAQTLRDQDERRQSIGARTDNRNNTDKPSTKQGDNQQNNAHETSSAHRTSLHRRILGDTLTKLGNALTDCPIANIKQKKRIAQQFVKKANKSHKEYTAKI